jgi:methyl-accepting chemotaxis protein
MTQIMSLIRDASQSMTEIASSAMEQQTASSSIAQSTARLSEFTSEEVATAKSLASEVEILTTVSRKMRGAIERFKL